MAQKHVECTKFVIYRDAECLKNTTHAVIVGLRIVTGLMLVQDGADCVGELKRPREWHLSATKGQLASEEFCVRFVGVFGKRGGEFFRGDFGEPVGCG